MDRSGSCREVGESWHVGGCSPSQHNMARCSLAPRFAAHEMARHVVAIRVSMSNEVITAR